MILFYKKKISMHGIVLIKQCYDGYPRGDKI